MIPVDEQGRDPLTDGTMRLRYGPGARSFPADAVPGSSARRGVTGGTRFFPGALREWSCGDDSRRRVRRMFRVGVLLTAALLTVGDFIAAGALDTADRGAQTRSLESVTVVEMPAAVAQFVAAAAADDRAAVAATVVLAVLKTHPAAAVPCVLAALRTAPEVTESLIPAVLEASPDCALSLVSAAAERDDEQGDRMLAVVARMFPTRVGLFEREVAVVRARRVTDSHRLLPKPPVAPPPSTRRTSVSAPVTNAPTGGDGVRP